MPLAPAQISEAAVIVATGTGRMGFLGITTIGGGAPDITTSISVVLTVTVNVVNTRWYEINAYATGSWVTANGVGTLRIVQGASTGSTELTRLPELQGGGQPTIVVGQGTAGVGTVAWQAGSTGSQSFSITGVTSGGALRITAGNAYIYVKDLGT